MQRITELQNVYTEDFGRDGPIGIVRRLRQVDAQLFTGWDIHAGVLDDEILARMALVADLAHDLVQEHVTDAARNTIVFSGCGTSGRIAWLCARAFNRMLVKNYPGTKPCFHYLISGGDEALIVSKELPEDDPRYV